MSTKNFFNPTVSLNRAFEAGELVTDLIRKTAQNVSATVETISANTAKETQKSIDRATDSAGQTMQAIAQIPLLRATSKIFGANWFMAVLGEVNIAKINSNVDRLRKKYPQETSSQIAHRLILNKAWEAGQVGLFTNIIPPIAVVLLGIELAALTKLQAEMVYEIAAAYKMDLSQPARRGELLAIFGLAFGGGIIKNGLNIVEFIPGVGAFIGASSDAILLYGLGYTACRFYETKEQPLSSEALQTLNREDRLYGQSTIVAAEIMDRVIIHMIRASFPDRSWSEILPVLKDIAPSSVKIVATELESPQPLEELLQKLSPDFAPLLLSRCYRLARLDKNINPEEREILDAIERQFNLSGIDRG